MASQSRPGRSAAQLRSMWHAYARARNVPDTLTNTRQLTEGTAVAWQLQYGHIGRAERHHAAPLPNGHLTNAPEPVKPDLPGGLL